MMHANPNSPSHDAPNQGFQAPAERPADSPAKATTSTQPSPSTPFRWGDGMILAPHDPPSAAPSVCHIERLPNELLEKILLEFIDFGEDWAYAYNENIIKHLMEVCRLWAAVASRLALVNVRIDNQRSGDKAIECAHRLSKIRGGWTPTHILLVLSELGGPLYRFAELVQLFGRTVHTLKLRGWASFQEEGTEGNFPPAIPGKGFFPMLRKLTFWQISSAAVRECIRNVDPTKLKDLSLNTSGGSGPEKEYLNGLVFSQLEKLELGYRSGWPETPLDALKTVAPALKYLKIATTDANISEFVAHMWETWPGMLKHLEVSVEPWGRSSVTSSHPAVRELVELAKEKKLISFEMVVGQGEQSWYVWGMLH